MKIKRMCKICGKEFEAIKVTQFFCHRKCFKRDYYLRLKATERQEDNRPTYPLKKCMFCKESSMLDFDPIKNPDRFNAWGCPKCGATNDLIWRNQNKTNSYQVISQLLVTVQYEMAHSVPTEQEYVPFKLPIMRPEMGNTKILVMACETLTMADIQKKNRKKLLFS